MKRKQFVYLAFICTVLLFVVLVTRHEDSPVVEFFRGYHVYRGNHLEVDECPTASTVVVSVVPLVPGGRLGNRVWEYLSAWSLAQDLPNAVTAVPQKILNDLSTVFVNFTAPSIEELAAKCNATDLLRQYRKTPSTGNIDAAMLQRARSNETRSSPLLLVVRRFKIDDEYATKVWPQIHEQLPFKPELQEQAQKTLNAIKKTVKRKHGMRKVDDLQYVAVHVRRSDYPEYIRKKFPKGAKIVDEQFYFKAMDEMRKRLYPKTRAFVMVSDDKKWCKKHFSSFPDVFISGSSKISDPGPDLALLSACNHTIYAYGTYALTAAMHNAGGHTIVFDIGYGNSALAFAKRLNWTIM